MSISVPGNYIQIVDDAECLKIAKRNNSFVMSSPYVMRERENRDMKQTRNIKNDCYLQNYFRQ